MTLHRHDFSKTLMRAHINGKLMTPPKAKKDKEAGLLGATAKAQLVKVYAFEKYGFKRKLFTKYTNKGLLTEEELITLIALLENRFLVKNEQRIENDFFSGEPDILTYNKKKKCILVEDVKSCFDLDTFLLQLRAPRLNFDYYCQAQTYLDLTGADEFILHYGLVDTPEIIRNDEKKRLFYSNAFLTDQDPRYLELCEEVDREMTYSHIPPEERHIKYKIERDDSFIKRMKDKVVLGREWLGELQELHLRGGFLNDMLSDGEDEE